MGDTEGIVEIFANQQQTNSGLHTTRASQGEQLPEGYSRSYARFLFRDMKREIEVDQAVVKEEMDYLTCFSTIACRRQATVGTRKSNYSLTIP